MLRLLIAGVVAAHGIGHLLFLGPAVRLADWAGQTSHSWLLTGVLGDTATRGIAAVVWGASLALFGVGVGGFLAGHEWWRTVTVVATLVSLAGLLVFWDGIATSSAMFALVFDLVVLIALLGLHWPSVELAGS